MIFSSFLFSPIYLKPFLQSKLGRRREALQQRCPVFPVVLGCVDPARKADYLAEIEGGKWYEGNRTKVICIFNF
jgi:hypothetical protein